MGFTKGQTAMEFTLLITALLLIFLPIFYVLTDFSISGSNNMMVNQLKSVGNKMVDESREMYYLGLFSKEILTVSLPGTINNMSTIIVNSTSTAKEYVFIINTFYDGHDIDIAVYSEVPIVTNNTCYKDTNVCPTDCYRCMFNKEDYSEGLKNFKLETKTWNGIQVVNITGV